jgi:hypothetical protein
MGTKVLKIGVIVLVAVVVALVVLRFTGLEPANVPGNVVVQHGLNYFVRPGLWQQGEVVRTPVTDWSFVQKYPTVIVETRSPWFIPHSVRTSMIVRNNQVYIPSAQYQMGKRYPDRLWTSNVFRDPRVRVKIGDKIYEMTLVLVSNRPEAETLWGRNMEYWMKENGQERLIGYQHLYHAFQRNIPEYGEFTKPRDFSGLPGGRLPNGELSGVAPVPVIPPPSTSR